MGGFRLLIIWTVPVKNQSICWDNRRHGDMSMGLRSHKRSLRWISEGLQERCDSIPNGDTWSGFTAIHPLKVLSWAISGTTWTRCVCIADVQELNDQRRLIARSTATAGMHIKNTIAASLVVFVPVVTEESCRTTRTSEKRAVYRVRRGLLSDALTGFE